MIVSASSGHVEQQRRGRTVGGRWRPRSLGVPRVAAFQTGLGIVALARVARELRRDICRVFVNVREVRKWSGPSVAA